MALKYNNAQHRQYLEMTDGVGRRWLEVFAGDTDFYSAPYWDLLTGIKSAHTASKYVDHAIKSGVLLESDNPEDARSKLLALSEKMRERLDVFFDVAVSEIRRTSRILDEKGPAPADP